MRSVSISDQTSARLFQIGSNTVFIYHFNRLIRSRILWGFFAIIISLAFVATGSCFSIPKDAQSAGKLNGQYITSDDFNAAVTAVRGFGRNRDNDLSASMADRKAWESIAARLLAEKNGIGATTDEIRDSIRDVQAFQGANGFDLERYRMTLAENGLTPALYETIQKNQIAMMKIASLIETAALVSHMEMEDELASMTDRFTVQIATVENKFATAEMRLSDEKCKAYYEENKSTFALPDQVSVRYFVVPITNYFSRVTVPESDVQEFYDSHIDSYQKTVTNTVAGAEPTVTKTPIPLAEVRGAIYNELLTEEARYCAETNVSFTVYAPREKSADDFATLANLFKAGVATTPLFSSDAPPSSVENASEFATIAFELDPNREDSRYGIVKGTTRMYVIQQTKFVAAHTPTFDQVLPEVKARARDKERRDAFNSYVTDLRKNITDAVRTGKSFADAAKSKALNVSTSVTYTVSDIQSTKFAHNYAVAYGAATLQKGEVSEGIPASATQALLVYVHDRQPGDALASEMMRAQIRTNLARRRANNLFQQWLAWNLSNQEFKPNRPLDDDSDEAKDVTLNAAPQQQQKGAHSPSK